MAKKQQNKGKDIWTRLKTNYVFRNIVLAVSLLVIALVLISVLLNLFTRHNKYKDVPNFIGSTMDEAEGLARKDRLRIEINDSLYVTTMEPGVILEQRPAAGTKVKSKRRIFVTVNSYGKKMVDVPYVAGYSLRQAKNILETAGLGIEKLVYEQDLATNNILRQRVGGVEVTRDSKLQAEVGSGVVLVVGRATEYETALVPRVVGLTAKEAQGRIWEVGLNSGRAVYADDVNAENMRDARVYKQSPEQGAQVPLGTTATLWVSADSLTIARGVRSSDSAGTANARERFVADSIENSLRRQAEGFDNSAADRGGSGDYERQEVSIESIDLDTPSGQTNDEFFY